MYIQNIHINVHTHLNRHTCIYTLICMQYTSVHTYIFHVLGIYMCIYIHTFYIYEKIYEKEGELSFLPRY